MTEKEIRKFNTSTGKSMVVKKKVLQMMGVFDNVMIIITMPGKDGWCDIVLIDRSTGKELAQLGRVRWIGTSG